MVKISQLELILKNARDDFGDVEALSVDSETGHALPINCVIKTHPMTGKYGCLNRKDPVCGVVLHTNYGHADDLLLSNDPNQGEREQSEN